MTTPSSLADRTADFHAGPGRVLALPTTTPRVVSFSGSLRTQPDFAAGDELTQQLVAGLFHGGTRRRDRFALAEFLEDRGAEIEFSSRGLRLGFHGRCLAEDLPDVLALTAEMLREPAFEPDEVAKAVARHASALERAAENAGIQAASALSRHLYEPAHPNYGEAPEALLDRLAAMTPEAIRAFYDDHLGARDLILALAGDLDVEAVRQHVATAFEGWPEPPAAAPFATEARPHTPERETLPMTDRPNLDVRMGHPIAVRRDDEAFVPLYVAIAALGGSFSARLMSTVRDEQGLTYGIGASLAGVAVEHDAHLAVNATFSTNDLERGIEATLAEVRRYAEGGPTEAELADVKSNLSGSFRVGLATTGALARVLRSNAERGFEVAYLDAFPSRIEAVTMERVRAALDAHIDPDALHVVAAGTVPDGEVA